MTNEEYRTIVQALGVQAAGMSKILGITTRQAQRYAADHPIPGPVARLLRLMIDYGVDPETVEDLD